MHICQSLRNKDYACYHRQAEFGEEGLWQEYHPEMVGRDSPEQTGRDPEDDGLQWKAEILVNEGLVQACDNGVKLIL